MNLLGILLKALLSDGALKALAKKTGLSSKQLKKLLPLAVPLLLKMLTKNASEKDGALSLLGALTQHTSKKTMEEQIEEADTEDGGKMNTGSLEMSNVDLSREFTEMITTQRGFQANSRIITTSDSMLEELVNLKR